MSETGIEAEGSETLVMEYTNWRGETSLRTITPRQLFCGSTPYHSELQWILKAWDHDKQAVRDFALNDCDFTQDGSI